MKNTLQINDIDLKNKNIILVGCGNMGFAMLKGWIKQEVVDAKSLIVIEPNISMQERVKGLGVKVFSNIHDRDKDIKPCLVIFAVKPQIMDKIVKDYCQFAQDCTFLTIAAGLPIAFFSNILGEETAIIRCMPNTPAAIGEGMMVIFANANVGETMQNFVKDLLTVNGAVATIFDESLMDVVTGLSGSGPAYVFLMIEAMTKAGVALGLPEEIAALLACQTVKGAGALAAQSSDSPTILREQVTSPNGTTAAGLAVLMEDNRLEKLLYEAIKAATDRAIELGK